MTKNQSISAIGKKAEIIIKSLKDLLNTKYLIGEIYYEMKTTILDIEATATTLTDLFRATLTEETILKTKIRQGNSVS